jgi:hypothetical protein
MLNKIFFLGVFLILLFSCGCLDNKSTGNKSQDIINQVKEVMKEAEYKSPGEKEVDYVVKVGEAIRNDNLSFCEKTQDLNYRPICYSMMGAAKEDTTLCDKASNDLWTSTCYQHIATSQQNQSLCEKVKTEWVKGLCYMNISETKKDPSLCENISEEFNKDQCYVNIGALTLNSSLCAKVSDPIIADNCYWKIISEYPDPTVCPKISNAKLKENCYYTVAKNKPDPLLCDNIQSETDRRETCRYAASINGTCYSDEYCNVEEKKDPNNPCCKLHCVFEVVTDAEHSYYWDAWWPQNCKNISCPLATGCDSWPTAKCVNHVCEME